MLDTVLKGCLLQQHIAAGLEIHEVDDHLVILRHPKSREVIATYSGTGVRVEAIRSDATEWLLKKTYPRGDTEIRQDHLRS